MELCGDFKQKIDFCLPYYFEAHFRTLILLFISDTMKAYKDKY